MTEIALNVVYLVLGIGVLIQTGGYVVKSLSRIAEFLGASEFTISFLVMAFATSLPELAVGINAGITETAQISLGNIVGTNIVNITLVMGAIVLVAGKVRMTDYGQFISDRLFNFVLIMSPVIFIADGVLSMVDGVALLFLFTWQVTRLLNIRERLRERTLTVRRVKERFGEAMEETKEFFKNILIFLVSVVFLLVSSYVIVFSAKNISLVLGLPELLIGLFVVGLGTSLPEIVFGIQSALSGRGGMSLGNIFGSSVMNATLVLGVTAVLDPIQLNGEVSFWISAFFMGATMLLAYLFLRTKDYLERKEGVWLIFAYVIFILVHLSYNIF